MGDGCTCGVMMVIKLAEMESDRDQVLAELTNLAEIHNQSIAELASVTNDKEYTENLLDGERKKAEKLAAKLASEKKKGALRDPTPDPRAARERARVPFGGFRFGREDRCTNQDG